MFRTGFILDARRDAIWFLGLPFVAVAVGFACNAWASMAVGASIALWVTFPHHLATWVRAYGTKSEILRGGSRLFIGPIVLLAAIYYGLTLAPMTVFLVLLLWDNQHSVMQQHGFARIYDFKAKTGAPSTGRFDLMLGAGLYANLFIASPIFTSDWLRELYIFGLPLSTETVRVIQSVSWVLCLAILLVYVGHLGWLVRRGYALNPIKYLFLAASYGLWYVTCFHSNSILVYQVAHRLMHGLQYIVFVRAYLQRQGVAQAERTGRRPWRSRATILAALAMIYVFAMHLISREPAEILGFGGQTFLWFYKDVDAALGIAPMTLDTSRALFASLVMGGVAMTHYYVDSFIWKVRDRGVQENL